MSARSLYLEMDEAADKMPAGATFWPNCAILFRQIQKRRHPDLADEHMIEAFKDWAYAYLGLKALREGERRDRFARIRQRLSEPPRLSDAERAELAGEIAQLVGPQRPEPPAEAVWGDG